MIIIYYIFKISGSDVYNIDKLIGEGSYAKVYKGVDVRSNKVVALKVQKPSWIWEYYICHQIKIRLSNPNMVSIIWFLVDKNR